MEEKRLRLGETLVSAKVLSEKQLGEALELQKKSDKRLGTILIDNGFILEPQLVQALSRQMAIPWVSLWQVDIDDALLDLVPANLCEEYSLIPIYIRSTIQGKRELFVAMNDPTDLEALRFISAATGMVVKPMVAGPTDIYQSIRLYYYDEEPEEEMDEEEDKIDEITDADELLEIVESDDDDESESEKKDISQSEERTPEKKESLPEDKIKVTDSAVSNDEPESSDESYDSSLPSEPPLPSATGFGFSMTFLDGTTIKMGKKRTKKSQGFSEKDLLAGLRAMAGGTPMDDFLPSTKSEDYIAAILELLLKKHLIFFKEYMDILKKKSDK